MREKKETRKKCIQRMKVQREREREEASKKGWSAEEKDELLEMAEKGRTFRS